VCTWVGNQWSRGVVTARVQTDTVRSLRHQHRDLHQSTYPIPLGRSGLILLSPSLKDIVRDQLRISTKVGRKLLTTDKFLKSIDNKMNNFTVAVQNQLNFNKALEMRIA
jgi:hypothetical protein